MLISLKILEEREFDKYNTRTSILCNTEDTIRRYIDNLRLTYGKVLKGFAQTADMSYHHPCVYVKCAD